MKVVRLAALCTAIPPPQEIFLVLICVGGWFDPRAIMRPEGLSQWSMKNLDDPIGNQTCYLPACSVVKLYEVHSKIWFDCPAVWKLFPPKFNTSTTHTFSALLLFPVRISVLWLLFTALSSYDWACFKTAFLLQIFIFCWRRGWTCFSMRLSSHDLSLWVLTAPKY
jgi:hypothetical protein